MGNAITLTSDQKIPVGVTILDKGGEAYASMDDMPAGYEVTFESSDPDVIGVHEREDGLNADLSTDNIGTSTLTVSVKGPDGTHLAGSPDTTEITVRNAEPGSANVTFGAPEQE